MISLIGQDTGNTLDDTELRTWNSISPVLPEYVEDAEIQAWLHLQEQLKLDSQDNNDPICSANRSGSGFSLKAFFLHGLQLSGHILSNHLGAVTPQLKSHQESSSNPDSGIIAYRQHQLYHANTSYTHIPNNIDITGPLLPNNNNTDKQDMYHAVSVPRYSNTTDKQHNGIGLLASLESQENIASNGGSEIEPLQGDVERAAAVTVVASTWYKYPLRTIYVGAACVGLYYAYNKISSIISNACDPIGAPNINEHEELPKPDMLLDRNNGKRSEFAGNHLDIGIRNIEFGPIPKEPKGIEDNNVRVVPEHEQKIQEEPGHTTIIFGHINITSIESNDSVIIKTSESDFGHMGLDELSGKNENVARLAPDQSYHGASDDGTQKQVASPYLSNMDIQEGQSAGAKLELTVAELQYDKVTGANHKLNISYIVLSSMDRHFYNRYFFHIIQDTISANDEEIYSSSQFIKQLFSYIVDEMVAIVDTKPLMVTGLTSYLHTLYGIMSTMHQTYPAQLSNCKTNAITKVYDSFYDSVIVVSSMISNITLATLDIKKFFMELVDESSNDKYIPTPESIANVMTFTKKQIYLLPKLYQDNQNMLDRAISSACAEIYHLGKQLVTDTDPNNIHYYKSYMNQNRLRMVMKNGAQAVGYSAFSTMCAMIIYYKILSEFKYVAMLVDRVNDVRTLDTKSPSSNNSLAGGNTNYTSVSGTDTTTQMQDLTNHGSNNIKDAVITGDLGYKLTNSTHSGVSSLYLGASGAASAGVIYAYGMLSPVKNIVPLNAVQVPSGSSASQIASLEDDAINSANSHTHPLCILEHSFTEFLNGLAASTTKDQDAIIIIKQSYLDGLLPGRTWSVYHPAKDGDAPLYAINVYEETSATLYGLLEKYHQVARLLKQGNIMDNDDLVHYMEQALDTTDKSIIIDAIKHIYQAATKGAENTMRYINNKFHNIAIASSERIMFTNKDGGDECYVTTLSKNELHECPLAFVIPGSDSLNIIADHPLDSTDIAETLMHEMSHITRDGFDLFYIPTDLLGMLPYARHARMHIQKYLQSAFRGTNHLNMFVELYRNRCAQEGYELGEAEVYTMMYHEYINNEAFRAKILYTNADNIALYIRDISIMQPSS